MSKRRLPVDWWIEVKNCKWRNSMLSLPPWFTGKPHVRKWIELLACHSGTWTEVTPSKLVYYHLLYLTIEEYFQLMIYMLHATPCCFYHHDIIDGFRKWIGLLVTGTDILTLTCAEVIFKSCVSSVVETNYSRILSTYAIYVYFWLIRLNMIEFWRGYIMVKIIW